MYYHFVVTYILLQECIDDPSLVNFPVEVAEKLLKIIPNNEKKEVKTMSQFKCKVCGYIHEGEEAPEKCPVCKQPKEVSGLKIRDHLFLILFSLSSLISFLPARSPTRRTQLSWEHCNLI